MSKVKEVMTPSPVTVSTDTYATKVRSIFRDEGFRCIPVVSNKHLEGIITRGDMMHISSTKSNIDARGIMEHPKVIATPNMDITDVAKKLIESDVVQAPVVESAENMILVGIISVIDILEELLDKGYKSNYSTLDEIKTGDVIICNHDDHISKVWNKMDETGFSGLPVMKKGKIIGMITRKDIINSGHIRIGKESGDVKRSPKVEKIMKTPPIVVTSDTQIKDAADLMVKCDIGRLPVVKNPVYIKKEAYRSKEAKIIGIVAREDILGSYLN
ncbi:MAG: CBS domain-containing protein [Euryarchaeota archaeon]|nr:CBS domain-containing protein [Euryarchaeota archaeon]